MPRSAALLVPLALLPACTTPHLDAMGRYGQFSLDGDLAVSSTGVSSANSIDTLGLDDEEGALGARVDFDWSTAHLTVATQTSEFEGDGRLESEISYGGNTIGVGANVSSDLELGVSSAAVTFDLIPGPVELGIGLGAMYVSLDAAFVEDGTGEKVSTDESVPFPVLAARAGIELGGLELAGLLTGLSIDVDEGKADVFDLDLFGRWNFLGGDDHLGGSVMLGWRQATIDVEYEDGDDEVAVDVDYSGPYVGLVLRF